MLPALVVALALQQAPQPADQISDHVVANIRNAVRSADAAAVVTVAGSDGKQAQLHVEAQVLGTLPGDVEAPAASFNRRDLQVGTRLLVFFRGTTPTGAYELVAEELIREYPSEVYLARVKHEHERGKVAAKPQKGPVTTAAKTASPSGT